MKNKAKRNRQKRIKLPQMVRRALIPSKIDNKEHKNSLGPKSTKIMHKGRVRVRVVGIEKKWKGRRGTKQ